MPVDRRKLLAAALTAAAPDEAASPASDARAADVRDTVERYAQAWRAGDLPAMAALYADGFTLHYQAGHALSGDHVGKAAALATLAEFSRRTHRRLVSIIAVMAGPERGAIVAREVFRNGEETAELDRVLVYAVQDGLLRKCWVYDSDPAFVARMVGER